MLPSLYSIPPALHPPPLPARPLRQVYPWNASEEDRFTIAIGFRCADGIVLAADSRYSEGIAKLDGQKIFPIPSNGKYAVTVAGAGGVVSIKGAVREIRKTLRNQIGPNAASIQEIQGAVEDALFRYYPKYVDAAPKERRDDLGFETLFGIWVAGGGARLFQTHRTGSVEVDHHACIGTGAWLTHCFTDLLFPAGPPPPLQIAGPFAAFLVGKAKKYVLFCGGNTTVRELLDDGTDEMMWRQEVKASEDYFESFFGRVAPLHAFLGDLNAPEAVSMEPYAKSLKDGLIEFMANQKRYRDKRDAMRRRVALRRGATPR